jgi:Lrp/AsnC family leucine-responsive transcriptional regulator
MPYGERLPLGSALDEVDLKIIQLLAKDARQSYADLGKVLHLSAPAVHARVKKLEKSGVIKNYTIQVDQNRAGFPLISFVRLRLGSRRCNDVAKVLASYPDILECHSVAGEDCLVLKIRSATTVDLQKVLDKMRTDSLMETSITMIVMESHFERTFQ